MTAREEKSLTKVVVNHGNNMKKNLINHGLPEHPWCPPVSSGGAKNQDHHGATKVINVRPQRKYFWTKRSDEYLAKKEEARKERAALRYKPREVLSCFAKDWALKDVLNHIGMYDYAESKLLDDDDVPSSSLAELYLFLVFVFFFTMVLTALCVYLFEGFESVLLGVFFF